MALLALSLEMTAKVTSPLLLDISAGSALRGAFFQAIWERFCTNHEASSCRSCPFLTACPVSAIVSPLRAEKTRGHDVPRPYVIIPPDETRVSGKAYEPGESLTFGLTLLGTSTKFLPYVLFALREMEVLGLGYRLQSNRGKRGSFQLQAIRAVHPFIQNEQELWQQGSSQIQTPQLWITDQDIEQRAAALSPHELTLHFLSPTRIIYDKQPQQQPHFTGLILRLAERFEQLYQAYGQQEQDPLEIGREWYLHIAEQTKEVRLTKDETRWIQVRSYSSRQHQAMPIDGLIGSASFEGDLTYLRKLLVWGEIFHVGKNATKGCGHYRIAEAEQR